MTALYRLLVTDIYRSDLPAETTAKVKVVLVSRTHYCYHDHCTVIPRLASDPANELFG